MQTIPAQAVTHPRPSSWLEDRYHSFTTLCRITTWICRFVMNIRARKNSGTLNLSHVLSVTELKSVETFLFVLSQDRWFMEERHRLLVGDTLKSTSALLHLNPTLGTDELAVVMSQRCHPILLHSKESLASLMFLSLHLQVLHSGPSLLLSVAGSKYHVIGARRLARNICKSCVTCRKCCQEPEPAHGTTTSSSDS